VPGHPNLTNLGIHTSILSLFVDFRRNDGRDVQFVRRISLTKVSSLITTTTTGLMLPVMVDDWLLVIHLYHCDVPAKADEVKYHNRLCTPINERLHSCPLFVLASGRDLSNVTLCRLRGCVEVTVYDKSTIIRKTRETPLENQFCPDESFVAVPSPNGLPKEEGMIVVHSPENQYE
jgi:hypothetical protein